MHRISDGVFLPSLACHGLQIHGDLRFKDHVQALVVNPLHRCDSAVMAALETFSAVNGVPIVWMADDPITRKAAMSKTVIEDHLKKLTEYHKQAREKALSGDIVALIKLARDWTCVECAQGNDASSAECTSCGSLQPIPDAESASGQYKNSLIHFPGFTFAIF